MDEEGQDLAGAVCGREVPVTSASLLALHVHTPVNMHFALLTSCGDLDLA